MPVVEKAVKSKNENNKLNKNQWEGITTFSIPLSKENKQANINIVTNSLHGPSKEELISQAFKFHSNGNIEDAAKYYKYFIDHGFKDPRVFSNYGSILKDQGKLQDAELLLRKAIELNPNLAIAYSNLGNILIDLGKSKEAESSLRKAIQLKPDYANAYCNLGGILIDAGKSKEAELSLRKAIQLKPDLAIAHSNLGNILKDLGRLKEAKDSYLKAIELKSDLAIAHSNLGCVLIDLNELKEAELSIRKAIEIKPNMAEAFSNLGKVLKDLDQLKEAEMLTQKAINLKPNFAEAHSNLGNILKDMGKLKEAEISTRRAIEINATFADAYSNLGTILKDLGRLKEAALSLHKAIEINPNLNDAYFKLSEIELLNGNYKSGLKHYEYRFKIKRPAIIHGMCKVKRVFNKDLSKEEKLLILSEQGLGDTLQYMRYIPYLKNKGFDISFCAQTKLHKLIKASAIDQNPLTPEQANLVSEGRWIPLLSLPKYLQVSPINPIINKPYIQSTDELELKWKEVLSKERRPIIGINWQGNQNMEKSSYQGRSIPLEQFSILTAQNEIKLLSLQKGYGSEQLNYCSFKNSFVQCQSQINCTWDFLENAAIIANCDLIITCDTSIAHLAGGMGKKVWLLLRDIPFWTWGLLRESTFWYPSMKLFRQQERHNWDEVMVRVSNEIKEEIESKV